MPIRARAFSVLVCSSWVLLSTWLLGVLLSGAEPGSEVEVVLLEHPARTEAIRVSARALEINFFIGIISFGV